MNDDFFTLTDNIGVGTYSDKRSKFLAFAHHTEDEDSIKKILASYKKKYFDARHVCYAYMLGAERKVFRANDDGEPSSTAGKPILGQINSRNLTNVLVVVVRYYGGVNLGTGGLIIAYRSAAALALDNAEVIKKQVEEIIDFNFSYTCMNGVMRIVKEMSPRIINQTFDNTCNIKLSIRKSEAEKLRNCLNSLSFK